MCVQHLCMLFAFFSASINMYIYIYICHITLKSSLQPRMFTSVADISPPWHHVVVVGHAANDRLQKRVVPLFAGRKIKDISSTWPFFLGEEKKRQMLEGNSFEFQKSKRSEGLFGENCHQQNGLNFNSPPAEASLNEPSSVQCCTWVTLEKGHRWSDWKKTNQGPSLSWTTWATNPR